MDATLMGKEIFHKKIKTAVTDTAKYYQKYKMV